MLAVDCGTATAWYARHVRVRPGMLASLSGTLLSMGGAMPYGIAAKFAHPDRPLILLLAGLAGCGGSADTTAAPEPDSERPIGAVTVRLDAGDGGADRASGPAGPPDAGVATGHGADVVLQADTSRLAVAGSVDPAGSTVRLIGPAGEAAAEVAPDGTFAARVTGLRLGANRVEVRAERPGRVAWVRDIQIVRR